MQGDIVRRFRKKPVVIEAMQTRDDAIGSNLGIVANWITLNGGAATVRNGHLAITTLEGPLHVTPGDWVIRGVSGEFYPCKPDIFAATYEVADP